MRIDIFYEDNKSEAIEKIINKTVTDLGGFIKTDFSFENGAFSASFEINEKTLPLLKEEIKRVGAFYSFKIKIC